jgi:hypothetical protein
MIKNMNMNEVWIVFLVRYTLTAVKTTATRRDILAVVSDRHSAKKVRNSYLAAHDPYALHVEEFNIEIGSFEVDAAIQKNA